MTARIRSRTFALIVLLCLFTVSRSVADALFDSGVIAQGIGERLASAVNRLDAEAYVSSFADGPETAIWVAGQRVAEREAIRRRVADFFAGRPAGTFETASLRALVGASVTWLAFDWTWGAMKGTQIARLERDGPTWHVAALDFDGLTERAPAPDFDPSIPLNVIGAPIRTMQTAAEAMSKGDMDTLAPLLDDSFEFFDNEGRHFEGPDALLAAAFTPIPKGISAEKMTLFVSTASDRAIAFQDFPAQRVSLMLERRNRWRVRTASLSKRLNTLVVSPRGRTPTTWGLLRRR